MKKKALRFSLFSFLSLLTIILLITGILYIRKDQIAANLIGILNDNQQGHVYFKDLSFTPFKRFPNISLKLQDLEVTNDSTSSPFIHINQAFGSINIIDLIAGKIDLSHISLENGFVDLVVNADGVLNISKTFASLSVSDEEIPSSQQAIELNLSEINIQNIDFSFTDARSEFTSRFSIKTLDAGLKLDSGLTDVVAKADFTTEYMRIQSQSILENIRIDLSTRFLYDEPSQIITVKEGELSSGEIGFKLEGTYDLPKEFIDVALSAEQNALGLLSILLEDNLMEINKNLANQGTTYFQGTIEGSTRGKIPNFSFDFGAENIIVNLPDGTNALSDFDLKGSIVTGTSPDFSEAVISLESLKITSPDGNIKGSFSVTDFTNPTITLDSEGKIDLNRFSRILKLDAIDSMTGNLDFETKIKSTYNSRNQYFPVDSSTIFVELRDVSLGLINAPFFHHVNGQIINTDSLILVRELNAMIDSSSFTVDGSFEQLFDFLFTQNQFNSFLHIQSEKFDILDFGLLNESLEILDFDTRIDVSYRQEEDRSDLYLNIEEMSASPKSYPNIEALSGIFHLTTSESSDEIEIKDLIAKTSIGDLTTDAEAQLDSFSTKIDVERLAFQSPQGTFSITGNAAIDSSSVELTGSIATEKLWLRKILANFYGQAPPDSLKSSLNTSLTFDTRLTTSDTLSGYFNLTNSDIHFYHPDIDTVLIEGVTISLPTFQFHREDSFRIENVLNADGRADIRHVKSIYYDDYGMSFSFEKELQDIIVQMRSSTLVGDVQSAKLEIQLSEDPTLNVDYVVTNLDLASLSTSDYSDYVDGSIDMKFIVSSHGQDINQITQNAVGSVLVSGDSIVLHGFDLDEILTNYKKSQNFRLTDVGAFMLMGPFGPVMTKGFDFARIAKINSDDSTTIRKFYSHWNIENEVLQTLDVAFATQKSRIAFDGSIDLAQLSIPGIHVYVVDRRGCSLMDQTITGSFAEPVLGDLNVVGTLFGAVINVFKLAAGNQCKPVYNGIVAHPPK